VNRRSLFLILAVCAGGAVLLGYVFKQRLATATEFDRQVNLANAEAARIREQVILPTEKKVPAGDNFAAALQKFGLSAEEAANASAAAQRTFNLRQVRAGNTITVGRSVEGILREIDYKIDTDRMLRIVPEEQGFSAQIKEIPSKTEVAAVSGRVDDSLFNAVEDAGESAELAMRLAQIIKRPAIRERRGKRRHLQRRHLNPFAEAGHARDSAQRRRRGWKRPRMLIGQVVASKFSEA